jgi:uncharacterized membrane protein
VQGWLWAAVFALFAWTLQRLLSKVALADLGTRKFYLLSATVSLLTYLPYLLLRPPTVAELPPASRPRPSGRGQLGTVSPITALSPALSAALGLTILGERAAWPVYLGIALAPAGIVLLSLARSRSPGERGWLGLALLSLVLQGVGAYLAKLVVAPTGSSALLLLCAGVQVLVGFYLAPPWKWSWSELRDRPAVLTVIAYVIALAQGPGRGRRAPGRHQPRTRRAARRVGPEREAQPTPTDWGWARPGDRGYRRGAELDRQADLAAGSDGTFGSGRQTMGFCSKRPCESALSPSRRVAAGGPAR